MPKKEAKAISQFRQTWRTAKEWAAPAALKKCDFNQGLGPAVDKVAKKWDEAAEKDPVPDDVQKSLVKSLQEAQAIILKYHKQIMEGNASHPQHGMTWYALESALKKLDDGMVDDLKDIGIKCTRIPDATWAPRGTFDKSGGKVTHTEKLADPEDVAMEFCRLARKIEGKAAKIDEAAKAASDGLRTCFGSHQGMVKKLAPFLGSFSAVVPQVVKNLDSKSLGGVPGSIKQIDEVIEALAKEVPPEGAEFMAALEQVIVGPLKDKAKKAGVKLS